MRVTTLLVLAGLTLATLGAAQPIANRTTLQGLLTASTTDNFEGLPVSGGVLLGVSSLDAATVLAGAAGRVQPGATYSDPYGGQLQGSSNGFFGLITKTLMSSAFSPNALRIDYAGPVQAMGVDIQAFTGFGYSFSGTMLVFSGAVLVGSVPYSAAAGSPAFVGFQHAAGITSVVFATDAGSFTIIDNHTYGAAGVVDTDGDGLSDADEALYGTNPLVDDTDGDGLLDGAEVGMWIGAVHCPDPLDPDSDGDTLLDGAEVMAGTNPCSPDTDGDGVDDAVDPTPLVPGVTTSYLEAQLRAASAAAGNLNLAVIDAPNSNAAKGRRNAIANKLRGAANDLADGRRGEAIDALRSLAAKLDGESNPPDWLRPSPERDALYANLQLWIALLELP